MPRADTPWTDPRPGDVCTAPGGKSRTVTSVNYQGWRHNELFHTDRRPGDWIDFVAYELGGQSASCRAPTWAAWCRAAVRAGGTYKRAEEDGR